MSSTPGCSWLCSCFSKGTATQTTQIQTTQVRAVTPRQQVQPRRTPSPATEIGTDDPTGKTNEVANAAFKKTVRVSEPKSGLKAVIQSSSIVKSDMLIVHEV